MKRQIVKLVPEIITPFPVQPGIIISANRQHRHRQVADPDKPGRGQACSKILVSNQQYFFLQGCIDQGEGIFGYFTGNHANIRRRMSDTGNPESHPGQTFSQNSIRQHGIGAECVQEIRNRGKPLPVFKDCQIAAVKLCDARGMESFAKRRAFRFTLQKIIGRQS